MKGLKIAALAALSLLLVLSLLTVYLFYVAEVKVTGITAQGASAAADPEGFERLKASVASETFIGTKYYDIAEWKDASDYAYITYTISLRNGCLVPIDMVELQIVPMSDDILQLGDSQIHSISARSDGTLSATMLTSKDSHPVRDIIVTYYVWGVSFNIKTTYGG